MLYLNLFKAKDARIPLCCHDSNVRMFLQENLREKTIER